MTFFFLLIIIPSLWSNAQMPPSGILNETAGPDRQNKTGSFQTDRLTEKTVTIKQAVDQGQDQESVSGFITDVRDGKTYHIVRTGSQWWMGENLDYYTAGAACYDNQAANCKKYGQLYDWQTAKKVCPTGWHLPNSSEWDLLMQTMGGELVAGTTMKQADTLGFHALASGYYITMIGAEPTFRNIGNSTCFWTSDQSENLVHDNLSLIHI